MKRLILCLAGAIIALMALSRPPVLPDYTRLPYSHLVSFEKSQKPDLFEGKSGETVDYYGEISCSAKTQCVVLNSIGIFKDVQARPLFAEWWTRKEGLMRIYRRSHEVWIFEGEEHDSL